MVFGPSYSKKMSQVLVIMAILAGAVICTSAQPFMQLGGYSPTFSATESPDSGVPSQSGVQSVSLRNLPPFYTPSAQRPRLITFYISGMSDLGSEITSFDNSPNIPGTSPYIGGMQSNIPGMQGQAPSVTQFGPTNPFDFYHKTTNQEYPFLDYSSYPGVINTYPPADEVFKKQPSDGLDQYYQKMLGFQMGIKEPQEKVPGVLVHKPKEFEKTPGYPRTQSVYAGGIV